MSFSEADLSQYVVLSETLIKRAVSFMLKLSQYKTRRESRTGRADDFTSDVVRVMYVMDLENLEKYSQVILRMLTTVEASTLAAARKKAFKTLCRDCMVIFKGVNELISVYNEEHPELPMSPITITIK
jgi:ribosomal protein S19